MIDRWSGIQIAVRLLSLASKAIYSARQNRAIRFALAVGLAMYFAYYVAGFQPRRFWHLQPKIDTWLENIRAKDIFASGVYPHQAGTGDFNAAFPYPPSAVVIFRALGFFGDRILTITWTILAIGAVLVIFRSSVAGENHEVQSVWLALGAIALFFSETPLSWDLRLGNYNSIYIGLALAAQGLLCRRPRFAGTLLGISISLKLYSALLLLWLLANSAKAALYTAVIAMVVLWIVIPVALFGFSPTISLYGSWLNQLRLIGQNEVYVFLAQHTGPPLTTLRRAIVVLTGAGADSPLTRLLLGAAWTIWVVALGWYAARAFSGGSVVAPSRATLADWVILLLAMLPFSPWLEPYHAMAVVPGTILCVIVALDEDSSDGDRTIMAGALLALLVMREVRLPLPTRGVEIFAQFLVLVVALGLVRPRLATAPYYLEPDA